MTVHRETPTRGRKTASVARAALAVGLAFALTAPGAWARSEDADLRARIEAEIAALPEPDGAEIRVATRAGQVLLQGEVRLLEQSLVAERAAWRTPGVLDVENELRVVPAASPGDAEIERLVRLVIKGDGRFLDTNLEVEVASGVVHLRGMFKNPADVLTMKHRVASIAGVIGVEIDALLVAGRERAGPAAA